MQMKPTVRYYYTSIRMTGKKHTKNRASIAGINAVYLKLLHSTGGSNRNDTATVKNHFGSFL